MRCPKATSPQNPLSRSLRSPRGMKAPTPIPVCDLPLRSSPSCGAGTTDAESVASNLAGFDRAFAAAAASEGRSVGTDSVSRGWV